MLARQKRLEKKRKEEQQKIYDENDANVKAGGGARRSSLTGTDDILAVKRPVEKKREIIISCPFTGKHMPKSEWAEHAIQFPANIVPGVWLGSYMHARDKDTLKNKLKVTHVLNCAKELQNYHTGTFKYLKLDLQDRTSQELKDEVFDQAVDFMTSAIDKNGVVFVHCQEGKSRSVTMITAYLMKVKGFSLNNSLATIASKRRIAQPNKGFMERLKVLEADIDKKKNAETADETKVEE